MTPSQTKEEDENIWCNPNSMRVRLEGWKLELEELSNAGTGA